MSLRLYSTLARETRAFTTVAPGEVRIYVCGVTPYYVTHLGHAFSYVQFDALRRYLVSLGNRVRYVQNVTDIDDDMIRVSREQGRPIPEIRDENDGQFRADLDRLNVLRPTAYPYATDHIPQIIEFTQTLMDRGHAYAVDGDVFFEASTFPGYGALCGLSPVELGKRENPESKRAHKKRGHLDFLLWQQVDPGDPSWESPWGPGRPGWSIECTAMSITHLGRQIDIHGGGSDLIYPHHTNEIAQAEGVTGEHFCGFWMHNGMLQSEGRKMAKSKPETLVFARDVMARYEPDQLRLYLLGNHYRADANFREGDMDLSADRYGRLKAAAAVGPALGGDANHPLTAAFREAMDDDLDIASALDVLDAAATRVLTGAGDGGEAAPLRHALATLGFSFAGARGPATGDFNP